MSPLFYFLAQVPTDILPNIKDIPKTADGAQWLGYVVGLLVFVLVVFFALLYHQFNIERKDNNARETEKTVLLKDQIADLKTYLNDEKAKADRLAAERQQERNIQIQHNQAIVDSLKTITLNADAQQKVIVEKLTEIRDDVRDKLKGA